VKVRRGGRRGRCESGETARRGVAVNKDELYAMGRQIGNHLHLKLLSVLSISLFLAVPPTMRNFSRKKMNISCEKRMTNFLLHI